MIGHNDLFQFYYTLHQNTTDILEGTGVMLYESTFCEILLLDLPFY